MHLDPRVRARLDAALGPDVLSDDAAELTEYGRDWTRVHAPSPSLVAFPRTTQEVAALLSIANEEGVAIVPSGGRTGLAGGAVAARGEVVLSLARMRRLDPVDTVGGTVRVQAGAITEAVHHHVAPHGLTWPVDFASKGSSHVCRYRYCATISGGSPFIGPRHRSRGMKPYILSRTISPIADFLPPW